MINFLFGFITEECIGDRCGRYPCRNGGKCLSSDQGAICLCPLGFGGDLCEMRLDLQVTFILNKFIITSHDTHHTHHTHHTRRFFIQTSNKGIQIQNTNPILKSSKTA